MIHHFGQLHNYPTYLWYYSEPMSSAHNAFWVQGGQEQAQGTMQAKDCQIHQNVIGSNDGFNQWIGIYGRHTLLESWWAEQTHIVSRDCLCTSKIV
jgi:hypothetical protein